MGKAEKKDSSSSSSFPSFASTAAGPHSSSSRPSSSAMDDVLGYYMRKKQAYNLRQSGSRSVENCTNSAVSGHLMFFAESGVPRGRRMRFRRLGSPPSSRGG